MPRPVAALGELSLPGGKSDLYGFWSTTQSPSAFNAPQDCPRLELFSPFAVSNTV